MGLAPMLAVYQKYIGLLFVIASLVAFPRPARSQISNRSGLELPSCERWLKYIEDALHIEEAPKKNKPLKPRRTFGEKLMEIGYVPVPFICALIAQESSGNPKAMGGIQTSFYESTVRPQRSNPYSRVYVQVVNLVNRCGYKSFQAALLDYSNAYGLLQIIPGAAIDAKHFKGCPKDLLDPGINIQVGVRHLMSKIEASERVLKPRPPFQPHSGMDIFFRAVRCWNGSADGSQTENFLEEVQLRYEGYLQKMDFRFLSDLSRSTR